MLKEMFENMMKLEEFNIWVGLNFVDREDLEIVIDNMNELELRELAADEMSEHAAYTVSLGQLVEWYSSYKLGLINE